MSRLTQFIACSAAALLVASSAVAGGLSDAVADPQPLVEETQPVSSLGIAGPLILLAIVAAAAGGGSSNGTTPQPN